MKSYCCLHQGLLSAAKAAQAAAQKSSFLFDPTLPKRQLRQLFADPVPFFCRKGSGRIAIVQEPAVLG